MNDFKVLNYSKRKIATFSVLNSINHPFVLDRMINIVFLVSWNRQFYEFAEDVCFCQKTDTRIYFFFTQYRFVDFVRVQIQTAWGK